MIIFCSNLVLLIIFPVIFCDNDMINYSNSVLSIDSIAIQLTAFYVDFTQLNLRISVSSDIMEPVYAWVDTGSLIYNNSFTSKYTAIFRFNITNPSNAIYLDAILDFEPPSPFNQTTTIIRLLAMNQDNATNVWDSQTVSIHNTPNMNYVNGFLTFNYQKSCGTANAYGFPCRQCDAKLSEDNDTCYTCDAYSGEKICCSGYYSQFCINSTSLTTTTEIFVSTTTNNDRHLKNLYFWIMIGLAGLIICLLILFLVCCYLLGHFRSKITALKAEQRIIEARIRREQILYEQNPFRGDPLEPPSPRLRPPPDYIRPPPREESSIPQNSSIHQVQPTFPRTSPHYSHTNSHQINHSRNYSTESDDDWRYATGAEHVV